MLGWIPQVIGRKIFIGSFLAVLKLQMPLGSVPLIASAKILEILRVILDAVFPLSKITISIIFVLLVQVNISCLHGGNIFRDQERCMRASSSTEVNRELCLWKRFVSVGAGLFLSVSQCIHVLHLQVFDPSWKQ